MNTQRRSGQRSPAAFRPQFGLAGAALLTALCVAALALTGSDPGSNAADADGDATSGSSQAACDRCGD
jgi:Spy/CpxP family protein refolding chaperone